MSALSPIEIASGLVLGNTQPLEPARAADPRAAMERALLAPLRRGPCLVSFSGGRDSSAVLAVATAVARREGLQPPIPATLRFPSAADSAETEWQEGVIAHLGLQRLDSPRDDRRARLRRPGGVGRPRAPRPALAVERAFPRSPLRTGARRLVPDRDRWRRAARVVTVVPRTPRARRQGRPEAARRLRRRVRPRPAAPAPARDAPADARSLPVAPRPRRRAVGTGARERRGS